MADEEITVEADVSPPQRTVRGTDPGPLVAVKFQKNPLHKQKYLESEPKALGITQIGLSVFQISISIPLMMQDRHDNEFYIPIVIMLILMIVAGSLAIAAQNLHLPTLKACFGMQIVACLSSFANTFILVTMVFISRYMYRCWHHDNTDASLFCRMAENTNSHVYGECILIQVTLFAISLTLAAYCCKVINCCVPAMPVVSVQVPTTQPERNI